jgi:hypothetical protein
VRPARVLAGLLCTAVVAVFGVQASETPESSAAPRYTFAWPLDAQSPKPRGGTTRGAPVALDREPSAAWQALQAADLAGPERDRRAILAMAGEYRVSFDFIEVDSYAAPGRPPAPYQSWATEKVYVDRDEPGAIGLVHILQMQMLDKDGQPGAPVVMKHWRQDWIYEPAAIVEFQGRDRWQRRMLGPTERRGLWSQTVHQVDESPRYASLGRWQHTAGFSTWISGETWRPLPRREWSVRDDYQVLLGTNRHTVNASGWVQEENNLKTVLTATRQIDAARPYLAREYGLARYERLRAADFAAADRYYQRTRGFWQRVRDTWAAAFAAQGTITLRGAVDQLGLFAPLFEAAERVPEDGSPLAEEKAVIDSALAETGLRK